MAGLAYLALPFTGLVAYFAGGTTRVRFHGLQAITIGLVWAVGLYAASLLSPGVTQTVYLAGAVVWIGFLLGALVGRDPRLPVVGRALERWARAPLRSGGTKA